MAVVYNLRIGSSTIDSLATPIDRYVLTGKLANYDICLLGQVSHRVSNIPLDKML